MARYPKDSIPKLTPELIHKICDVIKGGAYIETAVAFVGISKQTLYRWLKLANEADADPILKKLSDALQVAQAESEVRDLRVIDQAAQSGVWAAAAWRLERKHPDRWGSQAKLRVEAVQSETSIKTVDVSKLTTEELVALERALCETEAE